MSSLFWLVDLKCTERLLLKSQISPSDVYLVQFWPNHTTLLCVRKKYIFRETKASCLQLTLPEVIYKASNKICVSRENRLRSPLQCYCHRQLSKKTGNLSVLCKMVVIIKQLTTKITNYDTLLLKNTEVDRGTFPWKNILKNECWIGGLAPILLSLRPHC